MADIERVQIATHEVKDVLLMVNRANRRIFPPHIKLIRDDILSGRSQELMDLSRESGGDAAVNILFIEKSTDRTGFINPRIGIENVRITDSKYSAGLVMVASQNNQDKISAVGQILLDKENSGAGAAMVLDNEGRHMFFRGVHTSSLTAQGVERLIGQVRGSELGDFAQWNNLGHFYAPHGSDMLTPVLKFQK